VVTVSLPQDSLLGRTIAGKYLIESSVGSGAMGTVYRARQIALDKIVALKVLRREFEQNAEFVGRFSVEARAASKLDHPNSTRVMDFGREPDGLLYIAMEYLEGRDLYEAMRDEGPFTSERIANVIAQALAGIAVAHELGILHRDLKPENVMLLPSVDDEGHATDLVKVCDFGIAKLGGYADTPVASGPISQPTGQRLTRMGLIIGTPAYMSPEQACGEQADARCDIYAIGVILFELLTGRVPFEGATAEDTANMHLSSEPPNPLDLNPMASPGLARICLKALQKAPVDRYSTARDMRADIRGVMLHDFGIAPSGPLPLPSQPRMLLETGSQPRMLVETPTLPQMGEITRPNMLAIRRKRRATMGATAAVLLLGVAAGAVFLLRHQTHSRAAIAPPALSHVDGPSAAKTDSPAPGAMAAAPTPTNDDNAAVGTPKVNRPASATTLASAAVPARAGTVPPLRGGRRTGGGATPVAGNGSPAADPDPPPPPTTTPQATPTPTPTPAVAPVAVAPDPTPAPAPAPAAPAPAAFDPANARMSVGGVNTDRMSPRDVSAIMGRGDLKSCYVASVKGGESASPGPITLNLEVEDMRVSKARTSGGASSPSLRKCLESRLIGARVPSADTGSATASIPLTFSTQ
jgi:eukaryotic-like serine/threonine-protein kinase